MTTSLRHATAAALAVVAIAWGFAPAAAPVPPDAGKALPTADAKQRVRSKNNLKQIALGFHSYAIANDANFPRDIVDKNGKPLLSWRVMLLPYIEHDKLYLEFKLDEPWDSDNNKKLLAKMPSVYKVGIEEKGTTKTYYQGFAGPGAVFEPGKKINLKSSFTDGTSTTISVVEAGPPVEWTKPADIEYDRKTFQKVAGPFRNVIMAGMSDGSTFPFKPDLKAEVWCDFIECADGNFVEHNKARADLTAVTKEDKELALKTHKENVEILNELGELLIARDKLILEREKRRVAVEMDLEKLLDEQRQLGQALDRMKRDVERLKKELEKK